MKPTIQSLGGKARAAKLSAAERSGISRRAANARWENRPAKPDHSAVIMEMVLAHFSLTKHCERCRLLLAEMETSRDGWARIIQRYREKSK